MIYQRMLRALIMGIGLFGSIIAPRADAATPEQIDGAIKKGVAYLLSRQTPQGNWERSQTKPATFADNGADQKQWGGRTALCTYALLAAGEKPLSSPIVKATEWLRTAPISGMYAIGVRANVWLLLPLNDANKQAMIKDARLLRGGISKSDPNKGFYNYLPGESQHIDLSCSQYGVLGAWAAAQRLEEFPLPYWTMVENAWRKVQIDDGAWAYYGKPRAGVPVGTTPGPTIQMTAAGVATLFITQEFIHSDEGLEGTKGNIVDPWINKGLAWVAKAFPELVKKPNHYAMYGIERIGVASGYKYFGNLDWFAEGADVLVKTQAAGGAWGDEINTAFSILFLSRGRAPVMMNKLQYNLAASKSQPAKEANWNQRPRDVANATSWVTDKTERPLNWQIINFNVAGINDLHDSSILYLSGNQALAFTDKEKATLKQYIEEGGMIIGNADVGKNDFTKSFRDLGREMFPEYEFSQLQDKLDHPLMANQQFPAGNWKRKPRIDAMGNRARIFMVLIPNDDFSRTMQKRDTNRPEVFEFLTNAFLYCTDKTQARYKGQSHVVRPDAKIAPTTTTIKVARLKYTGRWDPEPGGWKRLAAIMNNVDRIKLETQTVELGKDSLQDFKIAHLTGTDQFALTDAQRSAIKSFVAAGGLLVVDACGGFGEFDNAAQAEMLKIFPNEASQIAEPFKRDHPLYAAGPEKLEAKYRVYAMQKLGADATRFRLRGINIEGKLGVLYSPDDLSAGLVGNAVDGIIGYEPQLAVTLMRRILSMRSTGKI